MAFGFNTSKQSSQSSSQASSLDVALSQQSSESLSRGFSQSTSGGQSTTASQQRIAFEDLLRSLYGGATDAATAQAANAPLFEGEAQQLFTGGLGFLDQLQNLPGNDYLQGRVTGPDTAAQGQIDVLREESGRLFNEELMPGITSRGVSTGTLGGSRQAVSIGKAAEQVGRGFSSGVASILANSQAARDAAALGLNAGSVGAAGAGLNALPSVLGLAGAGFNAGISPYLSLAQIIGSPTVLSESAGQSTQQAQSTSEQIAQAISEAISQSFGMSQSTSQSTSKGKSLGFSFDPIGGAVG